MPHLLFLQAMCRQLGSGSELDMVCKCNRKQEAVHPNLKKTFSNQHSTHLQDDSDVMLEMANFVIRPAHNSWAGHVTSTKVCICRGNGNWATLGNESLCGRCGPIVMGLAVIFVISCFYMFIFSFLILLGILLDFFDSEKMLRADAKMEGQPAAQVTVAKHIETSAEDIAATLAYGCRKLVEEDLQNGPNSSKIQEVITTRSSLVCYVCYLRIFCICFLLYFVCLALFPNA